MFQVARIEDCRCFIHSGCDTPPARDVCRRQDGAGGPDQGISRRRRGRNRKSKWSGRSSEWETDLTLALCTRRIYGLSGFVFARQCGTSSVFEAGPFAQDVCARACGERFDELSWGIPTSRSSSRFIILRLTDLSALRTYPTPPTPSLSPPHPFSLREAEFSAFTSLHARRLPPS